MARRRSRVAAAGVIAILGASGCSSGRTATPTSTSAVSVSVAVSSASSEDVPSPPSSSVHPSTTSVATTTLVETTTTVDEASLTKAAVAAAAVQSRQDYLYAVQNYDAPDVLDVLGRSTASGSPSLQLTIDNIENLRTHGWRVRPNPSVPSDLTVEGDVELSDGPPATKAELTACIVSAGVVFEPGSGPNGEDTVVNDEIVSRRTRVSMVLENGVWKLYTGEQLASWSGQSSCPPA